MEQIEVDRLANKVDALNTAGGYCKKLKCGRFLTGTQNESARVMGVETVGGDCSIRTVRGKKTNIEVLDKEENKITTRIHQLLSDLTLGAAPVLGWPPDVPLLVKLGLFAEPGRWDALTTLI